MTQNYTLKLTKLLQLRYHSIYLMLQSPGVSKREKIKETLKRLNPFKFKESKSGSNTLSRSSEFASASTFASSSALDHTNEAEVRVSFGVQPITLPQTHGRSKRRTAWNGFRNVVDMVGQAADVFPPLKSAIGAVAAILKTYDVRSLAPCQMGGVYVNSNIFSKSKETRKKSRL